MTNTKAIVDRIRERAGVGSGERDELVEFSVSDVLALVAKLESAVDLVNSLKTENDALRRRNNTLATDLSFIEGQLARERARHTQG